MLLLNYDTCVQKKKKTKIYNNIILRYYTAVSVYLRRYFTCRIKNNDKPHIAIRAPNENNATPFVVHQSGTLFYFYFALDMRTKNQHTNRYPDDIITSATETRRFESRRCLRQWKKIHCDGFRAVLARS